MPRKELLFTSDPVEVDDDDDVREAVFDHVTLAIPAGFGENNVRCVRRSVYSPSRVYSPSIIFPPLHLLRLSPPHLFFLQDDRKVKIVLFNMSIGRYSSPDYQSTVKKTDGDENTISKQDLLCVKESLSLKDMSAPNAQYNLPYKSKHPTLKTAKKNGDVVELIIEECNI